MKEIHLSRIESHSCKESTNHIWATKIEFNRNKMAQCGKHLNCPACAETETILIGKLRDNLNFAGQLVKTPIPGGNLHYCASCLIGFRHPTLSDSEYAELYDNQGPEQWTSGPARNDQRLILARIQRRSGPGVRILDVGCNTGELLASIPDSYLKSGIEINIAAGLIAASRRITVHRSLENLPETDKFDVIVLCDVIEHVANPASLILALSARLRVGGEILVSTGDYENTTWMRFGANWWYCSYAEHIRFISKSWAERFCATNPIKFEIVSRFRYTDLGAFIYVRDFVMMLFFGFFPKTYLGIGKLLKSILGRDGDVPVKGVGIAKDHILLSFKATDEN
jgi:SAM-dependent methyltransferase